MTDSRRVNSLFQGARQIRNPIIISCSFRAPSSLFAIRSQRDSSSQMSRLGIIPNSSMKIPTYYFITKSRFDRNMDNLHDSISFRLDCLLTTSGTDFADRSENVSSREIFSLPRGGILEVGL
ncbi:unnamed protein product [Microthlaspi erraticum]|uniref:Uncharacterized protein n=1 Tax=Microthlaspi erraticum TaxID=1685480 RepID=A0A6D2JNL6_9BRAS|nr:unnamed protein product [Microthlaspi erraticum]